MIHIIFILLKPLSDPLYRDIAILEETNWNVSSQDKKGHSEQLFIDLLWPLICSWPLYDSIWTWCFAMLMWWEKQWIKAIANSRFSFAKRRFDLTQIVSFSNTHTHTSVLLNSHKYVPSFSFLCLSLFFLLFVIVYCGGLLLSGSKGLPVEQQ